VRAVLFQNCGDWKSRQPLREAKSAFADWRRVVWVEIYRLHFCRLFLFAAGQIVGDGGANEFLQRGLINGLAFAEINGARRLGLKPGVEETLRILQRSPFEKIDLHVVLQSAGAANKTILCPHCRIPLPLFRDVRSGLEDQLAQAGQHFAAPVAKFCDLFVNELRRIHFASSSSACLLLMRLPQSLYVDFIHLKHGFHDPFRFRGILVTQQLA